MILPVSYFSNILHLHSLLKFRYSFIWKMRNNIIILSNKNRGISFNKCNYYCDIVYYFILPFPCFSCCLNQPLTGSLLIVLFVIFIDCLYHPFIWQKSIIKVIQYSHIPSEASTINLSQGSKECFIISGSQITPT